MLTVDSPRCILFFGADNCDLCKGQLQVLHKDFPDNFEYYDLAEDLDLPIFIQWDVTVIPTLIILNREGNKIIHRKYGILDASHIRYHLNKDKNLVQTEKESL